MTVERHSVSSLRGGDLGVVHLLLCSASFEERCVTVPLTLGQGPSAPHRVAVAFNENYKGYVEGNLRRIAGRYENPVVCTLRTDDPVFSADSIDGMLAEVWQSADSFRVVVDITAFTREALLILLQGLQRRAGASDDIYMVYTAASEYDVGNPDNKWLSQGIREVRSILGFPGNLRPSRPTHLIVMVGFEHDRTVQLITECEPTFVSLGVADVMDTAARSHEPANRSSVATIRSLLARPLREFEFSAYDPWLAASTLREQARLVQDANVIIAPMNTKVSTIGAGLIALTDPAIQLCYAEADIYNYDAYSTPGDTIFGFPLFGEDATGTTPA